MELFTIWRHLVDFGSHFGACWILKGSPNRQFSYKINIKLEKSVCAGRCLEKTWFGGWIFDVKMGGLDKPKQSFRIIRVAKYKLSGNWEI